MSGAGLLRRLRRLRGDRRARDAWDAGLAWFRLRYETPAGVTRCLQLLSRPEACGRVALHFVPDTAVSQLHLGVPAAYARLLQSMAPDFHFTLTPAPALRPSAYPLTSAAALPWQRPFLAHVVGEQLFVDDAAGGARNGRYLPHLAAPAPPTWTLPANPPCGLTTIPAWPEISPPPELAAGAESFGWPLGCAGDGTPLRAPVRLNLYGSGTAVGDWLAPLLEAVIAAEPAGLVVIDGAGDLVPRLKRKTAVTRLLGERLAYVDLDGPPLAGGFNPLAPLPGEAEAATLARWQRWFACMGVQPPGVRLLAEAQGDGVGDVPALRRWLAQRARLGGVTRCAGPAEGGVGSLQLVLSRLAADRGLREWLDWPGSPFAPLPAGGVLFTCRHTGWARQQLLRMMWLAAAQAPAARVVAHSCSWPGGEPQLPPGGPAVLISNGPLLPDGAVVLAQCGAQSAAELTARFLPGDARWQERIELLRPGEALVVTDGGGLRVGWNGRGGTGRTGHG